MWRSTRNKIITLAVILSALLIGSFFAATFIIALGRHELALVSFPDPFTGLSLEAKSAIVYNPLENDTPFEKLADTELPLASLTKVLTVVTALEHANEKDIVTITARALEESGEDGLYLGEKWVLGDLAKFSLVGSSNDGVRAIAEYIESKMDESFVTLMNAELATLGLTHIHASNPTGLDIERRQGGGVGTAREMAQLLAYAIAKYPHIMQATAESSATFTSRSGMPHFVRNTNSFVSKTTRVIASKTGTTPLAGGNLAIAVDLEAGRPIILVVLGSTELLRERDIEKLLRATERYYLSKTKIIQATKEFSQ